MDSAKGSTHSFEELPVGKHELKGVGHYFGLFSADIEPGDTAHRTDSDACGERNPQ
jgi:hypothetical protein